MPKTRFFRISFAVMFLSLGNSAYSRQVHTFQLEQDGIALKFRVSLSKDSFYLLEPITFDVTVKNISRRPILGPSIKSPWWIIKHESGSTYKYPGAPIPLALGNLAPGDSANMSAPLERIIWNEHYLDSMILNQYFLIGKYEVCYGPYTTPFVFRLTIYPNSKNHLRRKKFIEFCEAHQPGKYWFDTTLGVPWQLVLLGSDLSNGRTGKDPMESAYEFLESNKEMFGITHPRSELKGEVKSKNKDGATVSFNQIYKEITVWNSSINILLDSSGRVGYVGGTLHPDIDISTSYSVSDSAALFIVRRDFGPQDKDTSIEKPSLGILYYEGKYYVAWLIKTGSFRYFINAKNGGIINKAHLPRFE